MIEKTEDLIQIAPDYINTFQYFHIISTHSLLGSQVRLTKMLSSMAKNLCLMEVNKLAGTLIEEKISL